MNKAKKEKVKKEKEESDYRRPNFAKLLDFECQLICILRILADFSVEYLAEKVGCGNKNINKLERSDVKDGHGAKGVYIDVTNLSSIYFSFFTAYGLEFYIKNEQQLFGWSEEVWHPSSPCKELQNYAMRLAALVGIAIVSELKVEPLIKFILSKDSKNSKTINTQLQMEFNSSIESYQQKEFALDKAYLEKIWETAVYYKDQIKHKNEIALKAHLGVKK